MNTEEDVIKAIEDLDNAGVENLAEFKLYMFGESTIEDEYWPFTRGNEMKPKDAPIGKGAAAIAKKKILDRKKANQDRMKKAMEATAKLYGKKKVAKKKAKPKKGY